jgi:D-tyrosyl-tRNA(Tyr) deacylase
MRALLQRVKEASVHVAGDCIGQTGPGLLILVCAMPDDTPETATALATKIGKLRIFADDQGKTNLNVAQANGTTLVVSQFTLAADLSRGNRPGFSKGAAPDTAKALYEQFAAEMNQIIPTETGQFGAEMAVSLINDGPFTLWIDTDAT